MNQDDSKKKNRGKNVRGKKRKSWVADAAVLLAAAGLAAYAVPQFMHDAELSADADFEQWQQYKPGLGGESDDEQENNLSFAELQKQNPDVIGWLDIYNTNIDYPLMYSEERGKYMSKSPLGKFSLSGSIFLDERNDPGFGDYATLIYGHHMDKSLMFGSLDAFGDEGYFTAHRYGKVFYGGEDHGLETLLYLKGDADDRTLYHPGITNEVDARDYLNNLLNRAEITRIDTAVSESDKLVVLSTCAMSDSNERILMVCKELDWVPTEESNDIAATLTQLRDAAERIADYIFISLLLSAVFLAIAVPLYRGYKWECY